MLYHSVGKKLYSLCFLFYCHHRLEIKFLLTYLLTYLLFTDPLTHTLAVLLSALVYIGAVTVNSEKYSEDDTEV